MLWLRIALGVETVDLVKNVALLFTGVEWVFDVSADLPRKLSEEDARLTIRDSKRSHRPSEWPLLPLNPISEDSRVWLRLPTAGPHRELVEARVPVRLVQGSQGPVIFP